MSFDKLFETSLGVARDAAEDDRKTLQQIMRDVRQANWQQPDRMWTDASGTFVELSALLPVPLGQPRDWGPYATAHVQHGKVTIRANGEVMGTFTEAVDAIGAIAMARAHLTCSITERWNWTSK